VRNPVDLIASAQANDYAVALRAVLPDPGIDAVLVIFVPPIITDAQAVIRAICEARALHPDKPVLACLMGEDIEGVSHFEEHRIPVYPFPEPAAYALAATARMRRWRERVPAAQVELAVDQDHVAAIIAGAREQGRAALTQAECFALLRAYGIGAVETVEVASADEAVAAADRVGWPVVLKIASAVHTHKTDVGGVVLDLRDEAALRAAVGRLEQRLRSEDPDLRFVVQPMVKGGLELILGMTVEPKFGPVAMFGLGGIHVETLRDVSFRVAPMGPDDARAMANELRAAALLRGARGQGPVDEQRLIDTIVRFGRLVSDHPELAEMDLNPLVAFPGTSRIVALDARATLS
jgi:acetyltransferase